ncbi:MAG: hypothetical protein KDB27_26635 [Planctomycetales bacterium]|nr:hypothetical protein [Planctomycetales bacterium]
MVLNTISVLVAVFVVALIAGVVFWGLLSTGVQEADDPTESRPEDLTEYEKRHTHRSDVRR